MGSVAGRPQAFETIVYGWLAIGVLDFLDASIFFPLYYGITVQRVWHGVAAGLLGGEAARAGGWDSASSSIADTASFQFMRTTSAGSCKLRITK